MTTISDGRPGTIMPAIPDPLGRRARVDAGVRLASLSTLWLSLLLVTYWWETDRGVQDLAGWAAGLTSVGRLSGLVASVLLLAQVVLMARVPPLERAFGQDRLARLHRLVGFTSFNLMLVHVVTITWGYAAGRLLATPATLWDLTVDYPGMLLAAAGTAVPVPGRGHQHQGGPAPAALRVLAPAAPLRLPRRRTGPAAPAVDGPAVPRLHRPQPCSGGPPGRWPPAAVLVWRVGLPLLAQPAPPGSG